MQPNNFLRDKFDVLLVSFLFMTTFAVFVANPVPDLSIWLKDICQAFLYALLALVGVRVRFPSAVGTATTETGDVVVSSLPPVDPPGDPKMPPPADPAKENLQNEKPISE